MKVATKKEKGTTKTRKNPLDTTTPKEIQKAEGRTNTGEAGTGPIGWHKDYVGARDSRIDPDDRLETARNDMANPKERVGEVKEAMRADAEQAVEHGIEDDDSENVEAVEEAIDEDDTDENDADTDTDEDEETETPRKRRVKTSAKRKRASR